MLAPKTLTGTVTGKDGKYFTVVCDVPAPRFNYLRWHNLLPMQMGAAQIGDTVELTYTSTATMGYWHVSKVLARKDSK